MYHFLGFLGFLTENMSIPLPNDHVAPWSMSDLLDLRACQACTCSWWTSSWKMGRSCHLVNEQYRIDRRKFRSQTFDNMQRWKSRGGKSQGGEVKKWEQRRERMGSKKMQVREKVGKLRFTVLWLRRSRSNLAKAAGAEPAGQMRDEQLHAVVARSKFPSQKCPKPTASDHFWKLICRKSARRCGAKHISKSKCTNHTMFGPLVEVEMSKKCTPLWWEAHFSSQNVQSTPVSDHFWSWDVEKVHAVVARSTFPSQKCKKLRVLSFFWRSDVEKVDTD